MSEDQPTAPPSFDYDVFISYSSKDKVWVRGELLKRIEKAGLRAFIDYRDFTPGAPSIKGIERGVMQCKKTLLILTPDYIRSEWCDIESIMAQTLSPANRDLRMIPLLKAPCNKPLRIGALTHIDFTDEAGADLAWRQLLTALGAPLEPAKVEHPSRDQWFLAHPYAMPPNFTGRVAERAMLTDWLTGDDAHPLLVLRALGGFGKSALTWHWLLHDVNPTQWPRVVWWSFYEGDASFERFVANTLRYLSGCHPDSSSASSASPREQLVSLLRVLHFRGTLVVLDGFERALRAFGGLDAAYRGDDAGTEQAGDRDCFSPLAELFLRSIASLPGMQGRILITTRLRPAPVETRGGILLQGSREEELVQIRSADAVAFFHAESIRGGRAEIEAACEPYGYHPLSLRLLAGLIVGDLQQPGDIAAARRLDVSGDLVQRQHHVLQQAYESLGSARQKLLSRIACFRSPVNYDALKALAETESPDALAIGRGGQRLREAPLNASLRDLIARGLLNRDLGTNRFDLHPIVRRYAYDRLAAPDRVGAHARLRDYFAAVHKPDRVLSLDDLAPVIELYHHTVRAGQYDEALALFRDRLSDATYYQLGAYQLGIDLLLSLFPDGEGQPPRLRSPGDQAWTLSALASSYGGSGQPRRAIRLAEREISIGEKQTDTKNVAAGLTSMADEQKKVGELRTAEANLRRSIQLSRETEDKFQEAIGYAGLGLLLAYRGVWSEAESALVASLSVFKRENAVQWQSVAWACRTLLELCRLRSAATAINSDSKSDIQDTGSVIAPARRALELADETARTTFPFARDFIRAHWLLGAAHRVAGEHSDSERHLDEALERNRHINLVEVEGGILIDIARLRMATHRPDEAQRLADEALVVSERCGYVLQGADAHLVLAQLAKDRGDAKALHEHATKALQLATCDGPPDYTYKAAYDEAIALLKG